MGPRAWASTSYRHCQAMAALPLALAPGASGGHAALRGTSAALMLRRRAPRRLGRRGGAAGLPPRTHRRRGWADLTPRAARPDRARARAPVHWAQGCLLRRLRRGAAQRLSAELGRPGRATGLRSPDALQGGRPAATGDRFRVAVSGSKACWESGRAPGGAALLGAPWCSVDATTAL